MKALRYMLFTGCTVPARLNAYELATRKVAKALNLELVAMEGATCCGFPIEALNKKAALALAARNICIAEQQGLGIIALCPGCASTLIKANKLLKENVEVLEEINGVLASVNMEFQGKTEVKHLIQVLYEDVGLKKIEDAVERPLEGLNVATHTGCHLLRPSKPLNIDDPEFPSILDKLVECTSAKSVRYRGKNHCCGSPILNMDRDLALRVGKAKLDEIERVGSHMLVTVCPFCHIMFDSCQTEIEKKFGVQYKLPVFHYPQLLGLALGFGPKSLGLFDNRVLRRLGSSWLQKFPAFSSIAT